MESERQTYQVLNIFHGVLILGLIEGILSAAQDDRADNSAVIGIKLRRQYPGTGGSPVATTSCITSLCVLRASARKTHKLGQKDYLRRSRNMYGCIALTE
jgi:hypothetical protein